MTLSIAIMAHGKALKTFERHLPFWQANKPGSGIVICPEGDAIPQELSPWPVFDSLESEHNGPATIRRHRLLLSTLASTHADFHLIFEYDSLSISPDVRFQVGFTGIVKLNSDPSYFISPRYSTPPWLIDHKSVISMNLAAERWDSVYEGGYNDRWMAAMAHLAGVPILGFNPPGFTANTIGPGHLDDIQADISRGATMFHGVKDEWILNTAMHFFRHRS